MFSLLSSDRLIVSVAWVAHIVIYLLIDPPLSPFLNEIFIRLDDVWGTFQDFNMSLYIAICLISSCSDMTYEHATYSGLLGTAAFAFFCFYLLLAVIAGAMMLGLRLVFIAIHPMK